MEMQFFKFSEAQQAYYAYQAASLVHGKAVRLTLCTSGYTAGYWVEPSENPLANNEYSYDNSVQVKQHYQRVHTAKGQKHSPNHVL